MTHMTRVGWGLWCAVLSVSMVLGIRPGVAAATIAEAVQWLTSQAQADGSYTTPTDIATPWQATAETVRGMSAYGATPPTGLTAALQFLTADTSPLTELLARQIIATVETGGSPTAFVVALQALLNADGGYAPFPGYTSTVLDTAFALEALAVAGVSTATSPAATFLLARQGADGSWSEGDNAPSVYLTALVSRALWLVRQTTPGISQALGAAQTFLLAQRDAQGLWSATFETALTLIALVPSVTDAAVVAISVHALQALQRPDGSWEDDVYTTALVVRALTLATLAQPNPDLGGMTGQVVSAQTGLPLAQVTVALNDLDTSTHTTGSDGRFTFSGLAAGPYNLQMVLATYAPLATTTVVPRGQRVDVGILALPLASGTTGGLVQGTVTDATTGLPLAGVTVQVRGHGLPAVTDSQGTYQIAGVAAGLLTLDARTAGYTPRAGTVPLIAGGIVVFSPALAPVVVGTTDVIGTVTDGATGGPLGGVTITVMGTTTVTTQTDASGTYRLTGLTPGAMTVTTVLAGYDAVQGMVQVVANATSVFSPLLYRAGHTPPPAAVAPVLLLSTLAADTTDPVIVAQAAVLGHDPQRLFAFVRDSIGYEVYPGSLRGARGTLWSQAGNALDQASLLIALLRASGLPARYVQGTLTEAQAQDLLSSMFPPALRVVGCPPPDAPRADPTTHPRLLADTQDHVWVEVYTGGGFLAADPTFKTAQLGQVFGVAQTRFADVPQSLQSTVTVRLIAEQALAFAPAPTRTTVLTETLTTVALVGKPLSIGHGVTSLSTGNPLQSTVIHTYTPYLLLGQGDDTITDDPVRQGTAYQEVVSGVTPLANLALTGVFLDLELRSPAGTVETVTHTLLDRVSLARRQQGDLHNLSGVASDEPALTTTDLVTIAVLSGRLSVEALAHQTSRLTPLSTALSALQPQVEALPPAGSQSVDQEALSARASELIRQLTLVSAETVVLSVAGAVEVMQRQLEQGYGTKSYDTAPRLLLAHTQRTGTGLRLSLDVHDTQQRVLAVPDQVATTSFFLRLTRGLAMTQLTGDLLAALTQQPAVTALDVVQQLGSAGPLRFLHPPTAPDLATLALSAEAMAHISQTLTAGQVVLTPDRPVTVHGSLTEGWFEIDGTTGDTLGVLADGGHQALVDLTSGGVSPGGNAIATLAGLTLGLAGRTGAFLDGVAQDTMAGQPFATTVQGARARLRATLDAARVDVGGRQVQVGQQDTVQTHIVGCFHTLALSSPIAPLSAVATVDWQAPALGACVTALQQELGSLSTDLVSATTEWGVVTGLLFTEAWLQRQLPVDAPVLPLLATDLAPGAAATPPPGSSGVTVQLVPDAFFMASTGAAGFPFVYRAKIHNLGATPETYQFTALDTAPEFLLQSSVPAITVPPGETAEVGLCVASTDDRLRPAATAVPISVTVASTTTPAFTTTASTQAITPDVHEVALAVVPPVRSTSPGGRVDVVLTLTAVGNVAETMALSAQVPTGVQLSGLVGSVSLSAGSTRDMPLSLLVDPGVTLNQTLTVVLTADLCNGVPAASCGVPQSSTRQTTVSLRVRTPAVAAIEDAVLAVAATGGTPLAAPLVALSDILDQLPQSPTDARLWARIDLLVEQVETLVQADPSLVAFVQPLFTLRHIATTRNAAFFLQTALPLVGLADVLVQRVQHMFTLALTPESITLHAGEGATFVVEVANQGTEPTTVALRLGPLSTGVTAHLNLANVTLAPGEIRDASSVQLIVLTVDPVPASTVVFPLAVMGTAVEAPTLTQTVSVSLGVHPSFADVLRVVIEPTVVEPGQPVAVSATLLNSANIAQTVRVHAEVRDAAALVARTLPEVSTDLRLGPGTIDIALGMLATTGLTNGLYTLQVSLLDGQGSQVPGRTAQALFFVGTPVTATVSAVPALVLPGTPTVTTRIEVSNQTPGGTSCAHDSTYPLGRWTLNCTLSFGQCGETILFTSAAGGTWLSASGPGTFTTSGPLVPGHPVTVTSSAPQGYLRHDTGVVTADGCSITGTSSDNAGHAGPFRLDWVGAILTFVPVDVPGAAATIALGINDAGQIVGGYDARKIYDFTQHGFLKDGSTVTTLDVPVSLPRTHVGTAPFGINNQGQIVGAFESISGVLQEQGFLKDAAGFHVFIPLPNSPANSWSINQHGQIVGAFYTGRDHGYLTDTTLKTFTIIDLPVVSSCPLSTDTTGINDQGQIVGWYFSSCGPTHGFLTDTTLKSFTTLDVPGATSTSAFRINASGKIVGSFTDTGGIMHGFLKVGSTYTPLDVPGAVSTTAYDINAHGTIVGVYRDASGATHGFVTVGTTMTLQHRLTATGYVVNPATITPQADTVSTAALQWSGRLPFNTPTPQSFQLTGQVPNIAPGEVREISLGTDVVVTFTKTDGKTVTTTISLPPVVVAAGHLLALAPPAQTVERGAQTVYDVDLSNPSAMDETFTVRVVGLEAFGVDLSTAVAVSAGQTVRLPLTVTVPSSATEGEPVFSVVAESASGGLDTVEGRLLVAGGVPPPPPPPVVLETRAVQITLLPGQVVTGPATPATVQVLVTNVGDMEDTYTLAGTFPSGFAAVFGTPTVTVPPGLANGRVVLLTFTPPAGALPGNVPFTVEAVSTTQSTIRAQATGTITLLDLGVQVTITPASGTPSTAFSLTVTNTGQRQETFDLALGGPAGLAATLATSTVTPVAGATQAVPILLGSLGTALPGDLALVASATARTNPAVHAQATATVRIAPTQGVTANLTPALSTMSSPGTVSVVLQVHNTGNTADAYTVTISNTRGPLTAQLRDPQGQPTQTIAPFRLPALATGVLELDATLTAPGDGHVTVTVTSQTIAAIRASDTARVRTTNQAPISDAGPDQSVPVGQTVLMNGSQSRDPDPGALPLRFTWHVRSAPPTSALTDVQLAGATTPFAAFTTDVRGDVVLDLTVSDGELTATATVTVHVLNTPPMAQAGADRSVQTGQPVILDGSKSFDPDGDLITYDWSIEWRLTAQPAASKVTNADIVGRTTPQPTFTPDVDGLYVVQLIVHDGQDASAPAYVTLTATTSNVPPNARAGDDQTAIAGSLVLLDGRASDDPDHGPQPLALHWTFASVPSGSALQAKDILTADRAQASFVPDVSGVYALTLHVFDGDASADDTLLVTVARDVPPNAHAGKAQTVHLGDVVHLDGTDSEDPDNGPQPLTVSWQFVSVAPGSHLTSAALQDAQTTTPHFTPDIEGPYVLELEVFDGVERVFDHVVVTVLPRPLTFRNVSNLVTMAVSEGRSSTDLRTKQVTSIANVTITNTSTIAIAVPIQAVFLPSATQVTMPEASGVDANGHFVYDLARKTGIQALRPGERVTFSATFVRLSTVRFTYGIEVWGMVP